MTQTDKYIDEIKQIADFYLEQSMVNSLKNSGVNIDIYFDTYHILGMIQGYWELQTSYNQIDLTLFEDDTFIVKALAYLGYIKNIKILLPHLVELMKSFDKEYLFPKENIDLNQISEFLRQISFDSIKELDNKKIDLQEYLTTVKNRGEDLLKAQYVLSESIWTKRYNHLFKDENAPIVQADEIKYDLAEILQSSLCEKILKALSSGPRKNTPINNLRDAIALCMFNKKIVMFKKERTVLPLFYISPGFLFRLNEDIKKNFTVYFHGLKINTLKETNYFRLSTIFLDFDEVKDELFKKIQNLKESVKIFQEIGGYTPSKVIELLMSDWTTYCKNNFAEKILNENGEDKILLDNIIKKLMGYTHRPNSEYLKKIVNEEKEEIIKSLNKKVNELIFAEEVLKGMQNLGELLEKVVDKILNQNHIKVEYFLRDGSLSYFTISSDYVENQIKILWSRFLEYCNTEEKDYQSLSYFFTKHIYKSCFKSQEIRYEEILVVISILGVLNKYELIIIIIDKLKNQFEINNYSIDIIYILCMIKRGITINNQNKSVLDLVKELELTNNCQTNYKKSIGLGYVKLNIWKISTYHSNSSFHSILRSSIKQNDYFKESIALLKSAYDFLSKFRNADEFKEKSRNISYYYTLNKYLYYMIIGGSKDEIETTEFDRLINELKEIQTFKSQVISEFCFTVACYYYRKALMDASIANKIEFVLFAESEIEKSIHFSLFDESQYVSLEKEIQEYKSNLS